MSFTSVGKLAPLPSGQAQNVRGKVVLNSYSRTRQASGSKSSAFNSGAISLGVHGKRKTTSQKCAGVSASLETGTKAGSPLDIIKNDLTFLKTRLDSDNRESAEVQKLQEKLAVLKEELDLAHEEVHDSENKVKKTLSELNQLEQVIGGLESVGTADVKTPSAAPSKASSGQKRGKGLHSSLEMEPGLKTFWYPVDFTSALEADILKPVELLGETWVLFRDESGTACCIRDECAHRACPLSLGTNVNGKIECPYHGWQYRGDGVCDAMPSTAQCKGVQVTALECREEDGLIYVWPSLDKKPDVGVPSELLAPPGDKFIIHSEISLEVPVEHGLLVENLLDLAHAPFTHTSTFARGWPVPDAVKFQLLTALGGNWEPYPIDMTFLPPVMTLSTIGLNQPGNIVRNVRAQDCEKHLHQLHVCIPSRKGHTRLLYRMSLDFLPWIRHLPGIKKVWRAMADQVLGEDLRLVLGQQERLLQGGDTWMNPVAYDKLAVRYRRWRNSLGDKDSQDQRLEVVSMSAGEMLKSDE
ncbi:hypothetical protein CYMTET_19845 [Cymbomonas tetramitiformis]|uniref:Rieske domain-containing protein n=1 Tax=Cymbomonas tetramitiformis TaxID=36881 RepID=A0AAE0G565_9CHLO|nr:hypothetical protein CYMTET_19845 [Cymbomonas tetramitiformis]